MGKGRSTPKFEIFEIFGNFLNEKPNFQMPIDMNYLDAYAQ